MNRFIASAFCVSLFCTITVAANELFDFCAEQSQRRYGRPKREVLAVYYGWYGPGQGGWRNPNPERKEIANTARYPTKGAYSTHDPAILDQQIDEAKAAGITGFVLSWFGFGPDGAWINDSLRLMIERAEKKNFKVAVYLERAPGSGQDQINRAVGEISYALKTYGSSKAFLKVDGKPVIFVYGRVTAQVPFAAWPEIIRKTRADAGDFILFADGFLDSHAFLFDGLHTYGGPKVDDDKLRSEYGRMYRDGVALARKQGRLSCLAVGAGYDDRKQNKPGWWTDRRDGAVYRTLWEEAVKANPDWILIGTWNEWPEGTEIEPSVEFGDQYLKITREYALPFLRTTAAEVPPAPRQRTILPGTTNEIARLLQGRSVAVIPGSAGEAMFWAAYCGASVRMLDWSDLIDAKEFTAAKYPILLHARDEHFSSSVKVNDDVTRALIRYHAQGGFLVILPNAPWPFLYDDSRRSQPHGISDVLATSITGSPDMPPEGTLSFRVRTNILFGLSQNAPFPTVGDLRFTPASKTRVPAADAYAPLVQVVDESGRSIGDAAAYIEHRGRPLAPGKTIYVWMRTPEAFGSADFTVSLFQFAASRLGKAGGK